MWKRKGFTFGEHAIVLVSEFEKVACLLEQQLTLRGHSKSILQNYIRRIGVFVVHSLQTAAKSTIIYLRHRTSARRSLITLQNR